MADIDLKTEAPDTSLPATGFLFGADSQSAASPAVYSTQAVATALLGSTSLTGATVTADSPVLNLAQTWNNAAVTFTGLKFNVPTDSSASGSLLMDLQVGGSSRFNVGKTGSLKLGVNPTGTNQAGTNVTIAGSQGTGTGAGGSIVFQVAPAGSSGTAQNALADALTINSARQAIFAAGSTSAPSISFSNTGTGTGFWGSATSQVSLSLNGTEELNFQAGTVWFKRDLAVGSGFGVNFGATGVTTIGRDGANYCIAVGNGANAFRFSVYNTYTNATTYERFEIDWRTTANVALVGPTKGSGGGTQRVQRLQYLEDGGTGSTTPSLGTTCPAASATIKSWIKVVTSDGTTGYIPCWA